MPSIDDVKRDRTTLRDGARAAEPGHARPEFAVSLAILGVLLAIGVPALKRGQVLLGSLLILVAAAFAGWCVVAVVRSRG